MRALPVLRLDAFAERRGGGNPAAVVLDAEGLDEREMRGIAAELGVAGTAFCLAARRPDAHARLRCFTPAREVGYSGHTTLAAARGLVEAGCLRGGRLALETAGGIVGVEVEPRDGAPLFWLEPPLPECRPFGGPIADVLGVLGPGAQALGDWTWPALTPEGDLLLPMPGLEALRRLQPDPAELARLGHEAGLRGFCAVSLEALDPRSTVHSRFFAPHFGIPEDIVTGSVHSSLAVWLLEAGRLHVQGGLAAFRAEQGDFLGRPGRLRVEVRLTGGRPSAIRVGGRVIAVWSGSLRVP